MKNSIKKISQSQTSAILDKNVLHEIKGGVHLIKMCDLGIIAAPTP